MERRRRSVPAVAPLQSQVDANSIASGPSLTPQRDGRYFLGLFIFYLAISSLVGLLLSSRFPIDIAAFLFLTNGEFIEWALYKVGIRFVPRALGPEFIKIFAFLIGLSALLFYWKDSAPAWLLPWLPFDGSWSALAGVAFVCAALRTVESAVRHGTMLNRDGLSWAVLGFTALGLLGVLVGLLLFSGWL